MLEGARDYYRRWRDRAEEEEDLVPLPAPGKRSLIERAYGQGAAPVPAALDAAAPVELEEAKERPERRARGTEPAPAEPDAAPRPARTPVPAAGPPLLPPAVGQYVQAQQATRGSQYVQAVQPKPAPAQYVQAVQPKPAPAAEEGEVVAQRARRPAPVPVPAPAPQAERPKPAPAAAEPHADPVRGVLVDFEAAEQHPELQEPEPEIPEDLEGLEEEELDDLAEDLELELPEDATVEQKRRAIEAARAARQSKALKGVSRLARKVGKEVAADQAAIAKQGKAKSAGRAAQGKAAAGAAKAANAVRTFAKAKDIDELKARLRKVMEEDKAKFDAELKKQTEELGKKMQAERTRVADELKASEKKVADEIAGKEKEIAGHIQQKLVDARNRAEVDRTQARATTEAEKKRRRDEAATEARRLESEGDTQAAAAARSRGDRAAQELDGKLATTLEKIAAAEREGAVKLDEEKETMLAEARARAKTAGDEARAKHDAAIVKINQDEQTAAGKLKEANEAIRKGAIEKFDAQMKKLETGSVEELAQLEAETNKIIGEIDKEVVRFQAVAEAQIKAAQQAAAREAAAAVEAIKTEGAKACAAIDELAKQAMARVDQRAAEMAARQAAVAEEGQRRLTADTPEEAAQVERDAAAREKLEQDKVEAEKAAKKAEEEAIDKAAADIANELDAPFDTDEEAILAHLRGKTPEQIAAIKAAYLKKTGKTLDADLKDKDVLDENELKEAKAHLSGDPVQQAVAILENAEDGWTGEEDEQRIKETLAKLDPETRKKVAAAYEKQTGRRLNAMLADELPEEDLKDAYVAEDPKKKVAVSKETLDSPAVHQAVAKLHGATCGDDMGTDEKAVAEALKGKTPEEIEAIKQIWLQTHDTPLDAVLEDEMSGTELKEAKAMMSDDPVQQAVASLENASDGFGTDKEKLQATLESIKDPVLRAQVAAEYEKQTGEPLDAMLIDELSGRDLDKAQAAAEGDLATLRAIKFDEAKNSSVIGELAAKASDVLAEVGVEIDPETLAVVADIAIVVALGPFGLLYGAALLADEHIDLRDDENAMYQALEECETPEERKAMEEAFNKKYAPRTLRGEIAELDGAEVDVATALLDGNKTRARAAKVKAGSEQFGWADKDLMFSAIEECESKEEREALIAEFNRQYGAAAGGTDYQGTLDEAFKYNDLDREKAHQLTQDGKMDEAFALFYAQHAGWNGTIGIGVGTDEEAIAKILKGKSKEEIAELKKKYAALAGKYGREPDLEKSLEDETSGRVGKQIDILMRGEPTTAAEAAARQKEMADFEREDTSGWAIDAVALFLLGPINAPLWLIARVAGVDTDEMATGAVDCWNDSAEQLEASQRRLEQKLAELDRTMKRQPGESDADFEKRKLEAFKVELAKEEGYLKDYQAKKDATADAAQTATSLVVTAALSMATGGAGAWAWALIGGMAGIGAKAAVLGGAYEEEDFGMDVVTVIAEAIAAGVAKGTDIEALVKTLGAFGVEDDLIKLVIKEMLEEALENGTSELILALFNEANYKSIEDFVFGVGRAVAQGALGGAVAASVVVVLGDLFEQLLGEERMMKWGWAALAGGLSEGVGGFAAAAIDPATWQGDMESVMTRFGLGFIDNILSAGAEGIGEAVGKAGRRRAGHHEIDVETGRVFDGASGVEIGRIAVDPATGMVFDVTDPAHPIPIGVNPNLKGAKVGGVDPGVTPDADPTPDPAPMPAPRPVVTASPQIQGGTSEIDPALQTENGPTHKLAGKASDGLHGWSFGADVTVGGGEIKFTYKVFLDLTQPNKVTSGDLARFKANVLGGVDTFFNKPGFQLLGPGGAPGTLALEIQFVNDHRDAHHVVRLAPGDGKANLDEWFIDGNPATHAHELGHGVFGLMDEYADGQLPNRPVHADGSLMGDFWTRDKDGKVIAAPGTALKPRHLEQISRLLQGGAATGSDPAAVGAADGKVAVNPTGDPGVDVAADTSPPATALDPDAELALAKSQTLAERTLILGTDPKRGFIAHEGEVGPMIEARFGFFRRDPSGAAEWISLSGPFFGQTFDLVGVPAGKAMFQRPDMAKFNKSVTKHFRKSIDWIVVDLRHVSPEQAKAVKDYIDNNHAPDKHRLIVLE